MRKIYLSILAIIAAVALVGGAAYAAFTSQATSSNNTFTTGNADLQLKNEPTQPWAGSYGGASWGNLYPGWSNSYNVYLKNNSSSPITLKVMPKLDITSYSTGYLWDEVYMEITWSDGSHSTGSYPLRAWVTPPDDNPYLEPVLPQGDDTGPWVVKFSIPTTAGDEIQGANITFDLIFDGVQVVTP